MVNDRAVQRFLYGWGLMHNEFYTNLIIISCVPFVVTHCCAQQRAVAQRDGLRRWVLIQRATAAAAVTISSTDVVYSDEEPLEDQIRVLFQLIGKLPSPLCPKVAQLNSIGRLLKQDPRLLTCKKDAGQTPLVYAASLGLSDGIMQQLRALFKTDDASGAAAATDVYND